MAKPKQRTVDSWKKKKWHKILAPKIFNETVLGETPALEPNLLMGRTVKTSLMNLTRDMKKQNVDITFEVDQVKGDTAYAHVKTYQVNPAFIKRLVRRNKLRVDDSFTAITKDGIHLQIKPFILTRMGTRKSIGTALRKAARSYIARTLAKTTYDHFVQDLVSQRFQRTLKTSIKNIYNLRTCEIRVMNLLKKGEQGETLPLEEENKASEEKGEGKLAEAQEEKKAEKKEAKKESKNEPVKQEAKAEIKEEVKEKAEAKESTKEDKKEESSEKSKE
jgi:small subunit ribosomal protein S3Ae